MLEGAEVEGEEDRLSTRRTAAPGSVVDMVLHQESRMFENGISEVALCLLTARPRIKTTQAPTRAGIARCHNGANFCSCR